MRVYNIGKKALHIAGQLVRPGKVVEVDTSALGAKMQALHGKLIWIGDNPPKLGTVVYGDWGPWVIETPEQAVRWLGPRTDAQLDFLAGSMYPPLPLSARVAREVKISRIAKALFSTNRHPDPAAFFDLGWWRKDGDEYIEVKYE